MTEVTSYEAFREAWLEEVRTGNPSTVELGRRFAEKLVNHWLDSGEGPLEVHWCDGAGDGGIDVAVLRRGESEAGDGSSVEGDRWYLIQSKYGSAFQGADTLLREGRKVIDTLTGRTRRLSSLTEALQGRLFNFLDNASPYDRVVLVYGTVDPLSEDERLVLEDVRTVGRSRLGGIFDAEAVSVHTVYERTLEEVANVRPFRIPLQAQLVECSDELLIGATSIVHLYEFLKAYRAATNDLDQIYEKNVRRFLGNRGRVNKRMLETLRDQPERFGLFNNGITVVVTDVQRIGEGAVEVVEPYIVNGCQTTKTIWEVCEQKLDSGGTGASTSLADWRSRAERSAVITKVVRVGVEGEALLQDITRFTNSQNAVRDKDFLALHDDLRGWAAQMARDYNIYLEIQRGGWDSRRAWQRQHPEAPQFTRWANAFDLIKVYGAGWLREAGQAFGKNAPFLPGGAVFRRITEDAEATGGFGTDDLYAALLLQEAADTFRFGRGAEHTSRKQTRFLFYLVALDLLRNALLRSELSARPKDLSQALIALHREGNEEARAALFDNAIEVLDSYMTEGSDQSVYREPSYRSDFRNDLNAFLKSEQLGKSDEATPFLREILQMTHMVLGKSIRGAPAGRDLIARAVRSS